jgi:hypothetical protein
MPTIQTTQDVLNDPNAVTATHHCSCGQEFPVTRNDPRLWTRYSHPPRTAEQAAKDARRNEAMRARAGVFQSPKPELCERCGAELLIPGGHIVVAPGVYAPADGVIEHVCPNQPLSPADAAVVKFQKQGLASLLSSTDPDPAS